MLYARKLTYYQMTLSRAIDVQQNIRFLSSCQNISVIVKYHVTCQLNIQVKNIVQRYHFEEKKQHHDMYYTRDCELCIK